MCAVLTAAFDRLLHSLASPIVPSINIAIASSEQLMRALCLQQLLRCWVSPDNRIPSVDAVTLYSKHLTRATLAAYCKDSTRGVALRSSVRMQTRAAC